MDPLDGSHGCRQLSQLMICLRDIRDEDTSTEQQANLCQAEDILNENPEAFCSKDISGVAPIQKALHFACMFRCPLAVVKLLVERCVDVSVDGKGASTKMTFRMKEHPVRTAVQYGSSVEVVKFLMQSFPEAVRAVPYLKQTLLHVACMTRHSNPDNIRLIVEEFPESVAMLDDFDQTPLQVLCLHHIIGSSLTDIVDLLASRYPDAIQFKDNEGFKLVQSVCRKGRSINAILVLLDHCMDAAHDLDDERNTLLHFLLNRNLRTRSHVDCVNNIVDRLPTACLILNSKGHLAWGDAERRNLRIHKTIIDYIAQLTQDACWALIEVAMSGSSNIILPPSVRDHIKCVYSRDICGDAPSPTCSFPNDTKKSIERTIVRSLVTNDELQNLLIERNYQSLIDGFVKMNRAGRQKALQCAGDKALGATVLAAVSDNLSCLFLHLRGNPTLCECNPKTDDAK